MKNHFPVGYCPEREKVVDLSRAVLSGGRRYARHRRNGGRLKHKIDRQGIRTTLRAAVKNLCECGGDPAIECGRCDDNGLPARSETVGGKTRWTWGHQYGKFHGFADDLGPLFNWFENRTAGMTWIQVEELLRGLLLSGEHGNSLQTRHAYDHLMDIVRYRYDTAMRQGHFG